MRLFALALALSLSLGLAAHEHHAPHKGSLQVMGEEFCHVELVLEAHTGRLTAYVLDGEAEKPVRIRQKELRLAVTPRGSKGKAVTVRLKAVANELTGETVGGSSQFEGSVAALKGHPAFEGTLASFSVKGQVFHQAKIKHPEGNE